MHPMQSTQSMQATQAMHRRQRMHPTVARQLRMPAPRTVRKLPTTPTLPAVPALPTTAMLPAVPALPATATLPAVPTLPATATLPAVAALRATATLPAVDTLPATATLLAVAALPAMAMLSATPTLPATATLPATWRLPVTADESGRSLIPRFVLIRRESWAQSRRVDALRAQPDLREPRLARSWWCTSDMAALSSLVRLNDRPCSWLDRRGSWDRATVLPASSAPSRGASARPQPTAALRCTQTPVNHAARRSLCPRCARRRRPPGLSGGGAGIRRVALPAKPCRPLTARPRLTTTALADERHEQTMAPIMP